MIAAIYARKSTVQDGADADAKSVARQVEDARAFAARKGWTVPDEYICIDDAISGAETKKLVNRRQLLAAIEAGPPFGALIMRDTSRFSRRDGDEVFGEMKRIVKAGVQIWFCQDGTMFECGNLGANVTWYMRAEVASEHRRSTSRLVTDVSFRKARAGYVAGGKVYGYVNVRVGGHVERRIDETQAAVVVRIFTLCANGVGLGRIAKQLNDEGIPSPRPHLHRAGWHSQSISNALHRAVYRGEWTWGKVRKRDTDGVTNPMRRPEEQWVRADRPDLRIVSDELWQAAHARLDATRLKSGGVVLPRRESNYLLSGIGRCAICGGGFHVRQRDPKRRSSHVYACLVNYSRGSAVCSHVTRWPMEARDRAVLAALAGDVLESAIVEDVIAEARQSFEGAAQIDARDQVARELATVEREQARLADAVAAGGDIPILLGRLKATETKRRELQAQIQGMHAPAKRPVWRDVEGRIQKRLADWRTLLAGDPGRAREALRQLLTTPIVFTPFEENGRRGLRFEGRVGLEAVVGGEFVSGSNSTTYLGDTGKVIELMDIELRDRVVLEGVRYWSFKEARRL